MWIEKLPFHRPLSRNVFHVELGLDLPDISFYNLGIQFYHSQATMGITHYFPCPKMTEEVYTNDQ